MRAGGPLLALAATLLAMGAAHSQTSPVQKPSGDFYDMGNYDYFAAPPKTPQSQPQSTPPPSPAPVAPQAPARAAPRVTTPSAATAAPVSALPPMAASAVPVTPGNTADAREQAKAFAKPARSSTANGLTSTDLTTAIPGYSAGAQPQETLFDDPDALVAQGSSAAAGSDSYLTVTNPDRTVVRVDPSELARAKAAESDPESFLQGENLGGANSACRPLPPAAGDPSFYEATCNEGSHVTQAAASCTARIDTEVVNTLRYFYYGVAASQVSYGFASNTVMNAKVSAGTCRVEPRSIPICDAQMEMGAGGSDPAGYLKYCRSRVRGNVQQYSCSAEIGQSEIPDHVNYATGRTYHKKEGTRSVTVTRNEGTCRALVAEAACTAQGPEICTEGPETRIIEGVPVTQDCWAWSRAFMCQRIEQSSDCSDLSSNAKCTFAREECLDDPQSGACKVREKVFRCPLPNGAPSTGPAEYICSGDVYCINGDCEPIEREASTEFKDAMVAVQTMGQANKEFNEATLTLFSGTRETCTHKVFGLSNCCSGKGVPLLTPALCSSADRQLDVKEERGLCAKIGSYCSDEILGICVTKKEAHCCFESKLSRILQEQGRPQIGKPWAKPKNEQCKGFSVEEFARLDLSVMDFSEVYSEFMDAAKLPNEVETSTRIQQQIQDYYDRVGP